MAWGQQGWMEGEMAGVPNQFWPSFLRRLLGRPEDEAYTGVSRYGETDAAELMGTGTPEGADIPPHPSVASSASPVFEGTTPADVAARQAIYKKVYAPEVPKRSRAEFLAQLLMPIGQAVASAFAGPAYQRKRRLAAGLIGAGTGIAGQELLRPEMERRRIREEGLKEAQAFGLFRRQDRQPQMRAGFNKATNQWEWFNVETGKSTGVRAENPELRTQPQPQFRERVIDEKGNTTTDRWDAATNSWVPTEMSQPSAPATVAGPAVGAPTQPGRVPFISRKGDAAAAKAEAKQETLDQQYAAAIEVGDQEAQVKILKAKRKMAIATHISEPKGPSAADERDARSAEAFDVARALIEKFSPGASKDADPVELYKAATKDLYDRASKANVSARTKALVSAIEQQLYRQLALRFRNSQKMSALEAYIKTLGLKPPSESETE